MSVPAFADISKAANDLLNKDFYHLSAGTIEVKSNTPNNVAFKVTGKSSHEKATSGADYLHTIYGDDSWGALETDIGHDELQIEGKYADKSLGKSTNTHSPAQDAQDAQESIKKNSRKRRKRSFSYSASMAPITVPGSRTSHLSFAFVSHQNGASILTTYRRAGLTLTQTWNTANALDTKVELADSLAKGLKAETVVSFLPATQNKGAKLNLTFKQSAFHGRAFFDLLKGPTANVDAVIGHEGFLAGASAGYDVQKAAITGYSAAVGYLSPQYSAAVTATDNLSIFAASYYHKVNSQVEAGAKATWNSKSGNTVGLEVASKYRLDPVSFAKAKINDRGVAAVSYNVLLRPGVTLGLGASFDTQKLDQATHKVGTSFTFES
ncbi:eukaryotic porin/Tom40 [Hypoxylon rubiginosum]|uniref:Eukaryotic porin/Tom40 n=1 Tax=Hypoxylon rubiginosum TaxID=110542 RepID=A0ACC0CJ81_9PEZI|nr:eukaryotic porin/Tom40 [Hypoxylon rubiginosum]